MWQKLAAISLASITLFSISACGLLSSPAPKLEESGPAGQIPPKQESPFLAKLQSPPKEIYELEKSAGLLFEAVRKQDWLQAQQNFFRMRTAWQDAKPILVSQDGMEEATSSLEKLSQSLSAGKIPEACQNLHNFMAGIAKISQNYQLSPSSDIINIGNALREVSFYVGSEDWGKAEVKLKALESVWGQSKPALEKVGVLAQLTKTHSLLTQIKDAINAENKEAFLERAADMNSSLGQIRDFYEGK